MLAEPADTQPAKPAKPTTELPGRRLRDRREASQLTLAEVANHLRLDVQLIKALESDDFSHLPSPAYICGYLRSYARLLKLPEDEIVQAYSHGEMIRANLLPENVNILPQKKVINTGILKNIFLIIVILAVAGGLYWLADRFGLFHGPSGKSGESVTRESSQLIVPPAPENTTQNTPPNPAQNSAQNTATTGSPDTKAQTTIETQNTQAPAKTSPVPQTPSATPSPKPQLGKTLIEELPTPKNSIPGMESTQANPLAANKPTDTKNKPATAESTAAAAQTTQLRLHFNEDSWAEVSDSTGSRLVYHLVEKNTDLDLDGVPPFSVRLGNASAVQVFYRGKEIEHSQYRQDQVASFQVGEQ